MRVSRRIRLVLAIVMTVGLISWPCIAEDLDRPDSVEAALLPCVAFLPEIEGVEHMYLDLSEFVTRLNFPGMPKEEAEGAVKATKALDTFFAFPDEGHAISGIGCFTFEDEEVAARLPQQMADGYRKASKLLALAGIRVDSLEIEDYEGVEADAAVIIRTEGMYRKTEQPYMSTILRLTRGVYMVEVNLTLCEMEDEVLAEMVEMAFERLVLLPVSDE